MNRIITTIYIARHGESEHNISNQLGLVPEAQLTKKGRDQAKELAEKLGTTHFDLVAASDFKRAQQTAQFIAHPRKMTVLSLKGMRERSYGKLNGMTTNQIFDHSYESYTIYNKLANKDKFTYKIVPDMESAQEALSRAVGILKRLTSKYSGKSIIIVTHNTIIRTLLIYLDFADHHEIDSDCIANTAYLKVNFDGSKFNLMETSGIYKK